MAIARKEKNSSTATIGFEAKLWLAADKLRNNTDAAEYKHVVHGLIFLKYISDTFEELRANLEKITSACHSMAKLYPDFARYEAKGTVFGSINKNSFEKLRFVIPPNEIVAAYECQTGPPNEQIHTLENQSRTHATLRDTLLPKLLSGEFSVAEVESKLEAKS